MRILVASPGDPYSRTNFLEEFERMGHEVTHWDFTRHPDPGVLIDHILSTEPHLLFHVLVNDEIPADSIEYAKRQRVKTLLFCCDDDWRMPVSLFRAGWYDIVTTNDPNAIPIYRSKGIRQAVHVQYGVSTDALRPWTKTDKVDWSYYDATHKSHDVTFVGQGYIGRPEFIAALESRGIKVNVMGPGFPRGPVDLDVMMANLCDSKIVLGMNWTAGGSGAGSQPQIKARLFEAAALGCFQIVTADRRLSRYFRDDEIVTYQDIDDCADKIRYYLAHDAERKAIAKAGHERTLRDHTWRERWSRALPGLFTPSEVPA